MNYSFITDFTKSRAVKIGASDISWCIPHPIKQIESLAAYTDKKGQRHANTALDLYNEKITPSDYESNYPAEMGHWLEPRALYDFIADNISREIATDFLRGYMMHKIEQESTGKAVNPEPYNNTPFKHNTEVSNDYGVAHGDCLYDPDYLDYRKEKRITKNQTYHSSKLLIDLSKPFLIEAKSARSHTVTARKNDPYVGYDLTLHEWQGIPLKVYFQVQYQMALYNVDVCYVVLIFDTSSKHYWQIKANKKHQSDLIQLAEYMKKCIDSKTPPTELLMNSKDITALYPTIKDDFRELKEDELKEVLKLAIEIKDSTKQEKNWKQKKEQAIDLLAIHLKDTEKVRGKVGDTIIDLAKWKSTGGSEGVMGLTELRLREDGEKIEKWLRKKGLVKKNEEKRKPTLMVKSKELEGVEK